MLSETDLPGFSTLVAYLLETRSGPPIVLNISHEVLAGIVGASRQQVTEYLNNFDREKIIFREWRRIIVNIEGLEKILEGMA